MAQLHQEKPAETAVFHSRLYQPSTALTLDESYRTATPK
ncbi:hypothetical protein AG1IA_06260 [Rhizoctonia solani AG-1 IA]|uniref:Uncharacterized protein n=1 Tax=Thanatephorus cucumeris (strain AG1-IA) TaxID=983506 RepID=L8WP02_THACA|nr:hypothetical protein AG1IA_06260 [Rhizoctonia solani AG-1 IA]